MKDIETGESLAPGVSRNQGPGGGWRGLGEGGPHLEAPQGGSVVELEVAGNRFRISPSLLAQEAGSAIAGGYQNGQPSIR